jgi:hypothetical protein
MPTADDRADIVRTVEGVKGTVRMRHEWVVRFSYGRSPLGQPPPRPGRADDKVITAVAGPDMLVLRGTRLPHAHDGKHVDEFDVAEGDRLVFSTTWAPSHLPIREQLDSDAIVETTREEWQEWADRFEYEGAYRDVLVRSLLVLRLLTHSDTGGIVAAPTTSLPRTSAVPGNWDYRFCWLRDASLTLEALMGSGFVEETMLWRRWLIRAVAGDPQDMQIMYAVDGSRDLPEREIGHLPGYANSRPVRIGNAAVTQRQTDVLGEVMMALSDGRDHWPRGVRAVLADPAVARGGARPALGRAGQRALGDPRSAALLHPLAVMVWAAFDRAIRGVEKHGLPGPVEKWRDLRDQVRDEILAKGFNAEAQHLHAALRDRRGRRAHCCSSRSAGSCRRTTPRCSAPSTPSSRTSCTRGCCSLPHGHRGRTGFPGRAPVPRVLVLAGPGARSRPAAGPARGS